MDIITYLEGFYAPENVYRNEDGQVCVFIDEKTATGVSIPNRFRNLLRSDPADYEGPFLQHLSEIAVGYGEPIFVTHYRAPQGKIV